MKVEELVTAFNRVAPERLAGSWDKVGLHAGAPDQDAAAGLICIDLTHAVIDEALAKGCQLIVAYHPPIFAPLQRLTDDGPWAQTRMVRCVRAGLAVYSPHTALDAARGGMTDWLCEGIGEGPTTPIEPEQPKRDAYKIVVFVPDDSEAAVREAIAQAGAGQIGHYRECSFSTSGEGGFRPIEGANPTIGQIGRRETVPERRMEMIVPGRYLAAVIAALIQAHPYEAPAYDVFKLEPEPDIAHEREGAGRLLTLDDPIDAHILAERIKSRLGIDRLKLAAGNRTIRTVAVCPGAGGKLFEPVVADAYVTGEMQHHHVLDLHQQGRTVALAGHTNTERPYLPTYRERLIEAGAAIAWQISEADKVPMQIV
ncbi:MAG: Nif3-like dinuclear metal center hexameric protein [Phycisphaeraceae bacterium]